MSRTGPILRLAVPSPLARSFDYLPPAECDPSTLVPGVRLRVPFGRRCCIAVLLATSAETEVARGRLKRAEEVLDTHPVLDADLLALARWVAGYYHHPIGEVLNTMLPGALRQGAAPVAQARLHWVLTPEGVHADLTALKRAPRQAALMHRLRATPDGLDAADLADAEGDVRGALRALRAKGWVDQVQATAPSPAAPVTRMPVPALNAAQQQAVDAVSAQLQAFSAWLLDGVTGSGKTEVYLQLIERVVAAGRQALILVPEIGLTPQLVDRFRRRFSTPLAILHSGLSDRERLNAWLAARAGEAAIVIGTRSAVFTPLRTPGLIVVDEEHDLSLKQQDGLRYSARDVAVMRAHSAGIPIVLGSATPSLESLYNVAQGRYRRLHLPERAGSALHPAIELLDVRRRPLEDNLSDLLLAAVRANLEAGGQTLLFLNRRGYAPTLLCHDCGWVAECRRCDAHLILHRSKHELRCHHCGAQQAVIKQCPDCGSPDLRPLGHGTERVEQALQRHFPDTEILRVDRDSTRRKGAFDELFARVHAGGPRILVGTQMLAKGHHFPEVTLVGILDADHGLFGADFRAGERMAQLIMQVAGRAGRADKPGRVLIQTHHPDHPLLRLLIDQGYEAFAARALREREETRLPPYSSLALLRAEAPTASPPLAFLEQARDAALALAAPGVETLGPIPAPMERRAGRYRAQLLLQAARRADLQRLLAAWVPQLESLPGVRKVRWSVDVDPLEML